MNRPADHYFTRQECVEYEPILSVKHLADSYDSADLIEEEAVNCDSCIYFNSFECKIFK